MPYRLGASQRGICRNAERPHCLILSTWGAIHREAGIRQENKFEAAFVRTEGRFGLYRVRISLVR